MTKRSLFKSLFVIGGFLFGVRSAVSYEVPPDTGSVISIERFFAGNHDQNCRRLMLRAKENERKLAELTLWTSSLLRNHLPSTSRIAWTDRFALDIMLKRKIISAESVEFYRGETTKILPEQITNIETVEMINDGIGDFAHHDSAISGYFTRIIDQKGTARYTHLRRRATLRLTSGQFTDGHGGIRKSALPWMLEFPESAKLKIDRSKHKFIWEFGRAAQSEMGLTDAGRAIAAIVALRELQAAGGDISQAYVFAHAPLKKNADLYRRWGYEHFAFTKAETEDEILVIPLKNILDDPQTWQIFSNLNEAAKIVGPSFNPVEYLRMMDHAVNDRISDLRLNFGAPPRSYKVTLYDYGEFPDSLLHSQMNEYLSASAANPAAREEFRKQLSKQTLKTTALYSEGETNFRYQRKGLKGAGVLPEVQVHGLQAMAKVSENEFGLALLGVLRAYREKLEKIGATDIPARLEELFFSMRGTDMDLVKKHLRSIGVTFESHVVEMEGSTVETLVIEVASLLKIEALNLNLSRRIRIHIENRSSERIYSAPLNF